MNKKLLLSLALLLVVTVIAGACGGKALATVNGEKLTEAEFNRRLEQYVAMYGYEPESEEGKQLMESMRDQIFENFIEEMVIFQDVKKRNITASKEEVNKEVEAFKSQFASKQDYQTFLKERRFTDKEVRTIFENDIIFQKLFAEITRDVTNTDRDAKAYYEENKEYFYEPERIRARNIVVTTEEEAKAVIERLDAGEDFARLAVELSIDPTAKDNQGDIGYFDKNAPLVEEFKNAAFELKVGEYTKTPVQSIYGYHIIKVEDRIAGHQRDFEEVKSEIEELFIMEEKNSTFATYVDELMKNAQIERMNQTGNNQQDSEQEQAE